MTRRPWNRLLRHGPLAALAGLFAGGACAGGQPAGEGAPTAARPDEPHHVGADCASCHAAEQAAWAGSHHALAQRPVGDADRARFDGAPVKAGQLVVTPLRPEDGAPLRFSVEGDRGGNPTVWNVNQVIGVAPLQQYLVEADRGRLLVAPIAWDVAGRRWYDPAPDGAVGDPADPLYWAGLVGTWNRMCVGCHTTDGQGGYDAAHDQWVTTSSAPNVGCAACHGADGAASPGDQGRELAVCGPCHARGEMLQTPGAPATLAAGADWHTSVLPELRDAPAFGPDGGTVEVVEAFELGPFLQSRMAQAGVRCTDCHDPHSGALRRQGDATCTSCHADARYAAAPHRGHEQPITCVDCHMPQRTYMGLHRRHDHHLRRPDPGLDRELGQVGACQACHDPVPGPAAAGRADAAARLARAVAAARAGRADLAPELVFAAQDPSLAPFTRAGAVAVLATLPPTAMPDRGLRAANSFAPLLTEGDPALRFAIARLYASWGIGEQVLAQALRDPFFPVRRAALYSPAGDAAVRAPVQAEVERVTTRSDNPAAWTNLAVLRAMGGDRAGAEAALRTALAIDPSFADARRNLEALTGGGR